MNVIKIERPILRSNGPKYIFTIDLILIAHELLKNFTQDKTFLSVLDPQIDQFITQHDGYPSSHLKLLFALRADIVLS